MKSLYKITIFILTLLLSSQSFGQIITMPLSSAEKFNYRGYVDGNVFQSALKEEVSEYDGNLLLVYAQQLNLINGSNIDINFTYNANVSHKSQLNYSDAPGFVFNRPEWIIGINGIAVQVLNFESNYYSKSSANIINNITLMGSEVPLLIPGYHYSNKLSEDFRYNYPDVGGRIFPVVNMDFIKILKADGSIIYLHNEVYNSSTGFYLEYGVNKTDLAWVESAGGSGNLRKMWYKPGDGLTYYFEEEYAEYADKPDHTPANPKIMYLKKVMYPTNDTLFVDYANELPFVGPEIPGRKVFTGLKFNRQIQYDYQYNNPEQVFMLTYDFMNVFGDYRLHSIKSDILMGGLKTRTFYTKLDWQTNLFNSYRYPSYPRIVDIYKVEDEVGRYDEIVYNPSDDQTRIHYYQPTNCNLKFNVKLPSAINYFSGKKTEFVFHKEKFTGPEPNYNLNLTFNGYVSDNMNGRFRDCFTNFTLQSRKFFDNGSPKVLESYIYSAPSSPYNPVNANTMLNITLEGISTVVNSEFYNHGDSQPSSLTKKINFSRYKTADFDYTLMDFGARIEKKSEEVSGTVIGNKIMNQYEYNTGTPESAYWGPFDITQKIKTTYQSGETLVETSNSNTIYDQRNFSDPEKYYKISEAIQDPLNLSIYNKYKNNIPTDFDESLKTFTYQIGLKEEEKVFSTSNPSLIKSHSKTEYYNDFDGILVGKLKKQTDNFNTSRPIYANYYYNPVTDTSWKGNLSRIEYSNGVKQLFFYPKRDHYVWGGKHIVTLKDNFPGKILFSDSTSKDSLFEIYGTTPNPFKILTINTTNDTFYNYKNYDYLGKLGGESDQHGNYSEYNYDPTGRILKAVLPGSFNPQVAQLDTFLFRKNITTSSFRNVIKTRDMVGNLYTFANPDSILINYEARPLPEIPPGDDSPTEGIDEDAKSDSTIQDGGEGGGGGGGGGGTTYIDSYSRWFLMLDKSIDLQNSTTVYLANLNFHTSWHHQVPAGQLDIFTIEGIYDSLDVTKTMGKIYVTHLLNQIMNVNIETIINLFIQNDKKLFGFYISCKADPPPSGSQGNYKGYSFKGNYSPTLELTVDYLNYYPAQGNYQYTYDDLNNIINSDIKRINNEDELKVIQLKSQFDSFGKLKGEFAFNSTGVWETKNQLFYNAFGAAYKSLDGENRSLFTKYDYLARPIEIRYDQNWGQGIKKQMSYMIDYNTSELLNVVQTIDEENKVSKKYFDKVGNLKKEEKINGGTPLTTIYNYDNLYRLTSVVTPAGKTTSYLYDDLNNISQKTSPDEGTTKYKYDKYANLRFSINTGSTTALTFNKYDNFNRLILTGEKTFNNPWDDLNPDLDYSTTQGAISAFENYISNQSNFVVVNMYDKYTRTGVFTNLYNFATGTLQNLKGKLVAIAFRDKNTNTWSYKVYSYDYLGRVKDEYVFFQSTSTYKKITNEYDNLGNIVKQNLADQFYYWYNYDEQGRLKEVRSSMHDAYTTAKLEVIYTYDLSDKVTKTDFKSAGRQLYQTYVYDTKGRLDDLTGYRSTGTPEMLFREDLGYFNNDNVSSTLIQNKGNSIWANLTFTYAYDDLNRLTSSLCSVNSYNETYTYNYDGNLLTKLRPYNTSQSQTYTYGTTGKNYLTGLTKGTTNYTFTYDYKGNMLTDTRKLINYPYPIIYDRRNLPVTMTRSGVNYTYNYDDAGQRIYKQTSTSNKELYLRDHTGKELAVYDWYTGKLKMFNLYGNGIIGKVNVTFNAQNVRTDSRQYYFKDHLGSIRQVYDETATVVSAQDYYPYGEILRSYVTGSNVNDKYKFTEKERDTETNYDYFGARYYDSDLGRWLSVDPLADKYPGWSPYNYTMNNPLKYIDANGDSVEMGYKYIPMSGFIWGQDMYHTLLILTNEKTGEKTTIEGMPESRNNGIISFLFELNDGDGWGNLTNIPETRSAEIGSTDRETIPTPTSMTDEQFRNKLLEVNRNYQNDIEYKPFFNGESKTGNSNSFIYSVLKNSGSDYKPSRYAPGWYINIFKK